MARSATVWAGVARLPRQRRRKAVPYRLQIDRAHDVGSRQHVAETLPPGRRGKCDDSGKAQEERIDLDDAQDGARYGFKQSGSLTGRIDDGGAHDQFADAASPQSFAEHKIKHQRAKPEPNRFLIEFVSENGIRDQQKQKQHDEIDERPDGAAHRNLAELGPLGEVLDRRFRCPLGVDLPWRGSG